MSRRVWFQSGRSGWAFFVGTWNADPACIWIDPTAAVECRFTSLLLPDEPSHISTEYRPEFDELVREGGGTVLGKDGERRLRLWGLTLGMTL